MGGLQHLPGQGCRRARLVQRLGAGSVHAIAAGETLMEIVVLVIAAVAVVAFIDGQKQSMARMQRVRARRTAQPRRRRRRLQGVDRR